jgi:lysine biosynthesis protein LysW
MPNYQSNCPICDLNITLATDSVENEVLACQSCGSSLLVANTTGGFKLDVAPAVQEDWGE